MPGNEITYKFIKGRGWVAGYWENDDPQRYWALNFSEIEQRILDRVWQNVYQQMPVPALPPAPRREPSPRRYSARDWYARRTIDAWCELRVRNLFTGDDE